MKKGFNINNNKINLINQTVNYKVLTKKSTIRNKNCKNK